MVLARKTTKHLPIGAESIIKEGKLMEARVVS